MVSVNGTIWSDILAHVRLNYPEVNRGWFWDLRLCDIEGGVVTIRALNDAQRKYLDQACRAAFTEGAQAATGRLVSVDFAVLEADGPDPASREAADPFRDSRYQPPLKADFCFDNLVTGPCNRLAHAAAHAVADAPGRAYNPFFVFGAAGLGKTHLVQAICQAVRDRNTTVRCLYLSCETFINYFMEALERGMLYQFRHRCRDADLLVIDDIQFLSDRERSQEEFFHTFNTLYQSQRQIVLTADSPPSDIPSLENRLVSRFNSGLVVTLDPPCLETRMAIVRKKAKLRCIELPEEVVRFVASLAVDNIRELEGALLKIDAVSQTTGCPITAELAHEAHGTGPEKMVKIPVIMEAVADRFGVKVVDLQGKRRSRAVTQPRHICMYLARKLTAQSYEDIGSYFGGRDHSTVVHASRLVTQMAKRDSRLRSLLDEITTSVKNGP